ncbi:MAG: thiamine phosphate synthase [Alphaproteobacteria bacterium]
MARTAKKQDEVAVADNFRCRLYLITPPQIDDDFPAQLEQALSGGDVACLQIRLKDQPDDIIKAAAQALMPIAHAHDVAVLINDRPDLAAAVDADGAHVGQEDTPYKEARTLLGPDAIIGVTCHDSRHLAMTAGEQGADYVAFGAFFDTPTKDPKAKAELELLRWWASVMEVPQVAIGGITPDNARPVVEAGADFLAVSSGVWAHQDGPKAAVEALNKICDEVFEGA